MLTRTKEEGFQCDTQTKTIEAGSVGNSELVGEGNGTTSPDLSRNSMSRDTELYFVLNAIPFLLARRPATAPLGIQIK